MKICSRCKEEKPLEAFSKLSSAKDGLRYACRECISRSYFDNHEEYKARNRNCTMKYRYGIDVEEYERMLKDQKGVCFICGSKNSWKNLDIDHCHTTGKVRGLLCSNCNRGLGYFKDSQELLTNAINYLILTKS